VAVRRWASNSEWLWALQPHGILRGEQEGGVSL
jgi:hypothetical protein